jgi:hypothetical protein
MARRAAVARPRAPPVIDAHIGDRQGNGRTAHAPRNVVTPAKYRICRIRSFPTAPLSEGMGHAPPAIMMATQMSRRFEDGLLLVLTLAPIVALFARARRKSREIEPRPQHGAPDASSLTAVRQKW